MKTWIILFIIIILIKTHIQAKKKSDAIAEIKFAFII